MPEGFPRDLDLAIRRLINPDFPTPTRQFTDITLVLEHDPAAFRALVEQMCQPFRAEPPDALLCIESCGYLFGAPMALELARPIVLARRAGKLPRATLRRAYESSGRARDPERTMEIHGGAILPGSHVLVVDDVLATGGTALAALDLVEQAGGVPNGVSVAFELVRYHARREIERRGVLLQSAIRL